MEYVLNASPQTVLDAAERRMVNVGYSTQARSENSITFTGRVAMGGGLTALTFAESLFNPVFASTMLTAYNTGNTDSTTLLVRPESKDTTRVIIPDDAKPSNAMLRLWIEADILKAPGTKPMLKYKANYDALYVFNDRVEYWGRTFTPRWKHKGTIPMERIATVEAKKNTVIVTDLNGGVFKVNAGMGNREKAQEAKGLIEARMQVHRTLDPFEGLTSSVTQEAPAEGNPAQDIPDQLRKLAGLRDQGIITPDEFEAKKTDLLNRM
jgi:hypothetical protein